MMPEANLLYQLGWSQPTSRSDFRDSKMIRILSNIPAMDIQTEGRGIWVSQTRMSVCPFSICKCAWGWNTVAVGYYLSGSPTHLLFKSGMDPVQLLLPPVNVENRALPCYLSTRCPKTLPCYLSTYTVAEEKGVSGVVRTAAAVRYRLALLQLPKQLPPPLFGQ